MLLFLVWENELTHSRNYYSTFVGSNKNRASENQLSERASAGHSFSSCDRASKCRRSKETSRDFSCFQVSPFFSRETWKILEHKWFCQDNLRTRRAVIERASTRTSSESSHCHWASELYNIERVESSRTNWDYWGRHRVSAPKEINQS